MLTKILTDWLNFYVLISEREVKLEKVVYSLQNDVGNIRDSMESLKSIVVDKVEEMKCQLTAQSAELADMKGRMSIVY